MLTTGDALFKAQCPGCGADGTYPTEAGEIGKVGTVTAISEVPTSNNGYVVSADFDGVSITSQGGDFAFADRQPLEAGH
jgi:hypothetical protein